MRQMWYYSPIQPLLGFRYQYAAAPNTGFGWSYGPGLDHLRFPTPTPETLVQLTQPAYPQDSGEFKYPHGFFYVVCNIAIHLPCGLVCLYTKRETS